MKKPELHQFLTGATDGDAITGQALIFRRWLRELGFKSNIYAQFIHANIEAEVNHLSSFHKKMLGERVIYHHSIGSEMPAFLTREHVRMLLIYHNITPKEFFERSDPQRAELARLGQEQLLGLSQITELALAVSAYNERDLIAAGYTNTAVMPLALRTADYDLFSNEVLESQLQSTGTNILFVGRLAPNKKQEDLIKLLYYFQRLDPQVHLYLVGDRWEIGYDRWVEDLAAECNLEDSLTVTGKVSQSDLVTYYRNSTIYVSMSEHEGVGLPFIESMYFELPIIAYGVAGVPDTIGDGGVLFYEKDYEGLAELVHLLVNDQAVQQRVIARQKKQLQRFLEPRVRQQFCRYLQQLKFQLPAGVGKQA
ncbi:MAG: glycosyltransferase [Candidatus Promineifilaceae bacterium]|nr:glycosyltransferase [Candidatus Promineifilaceae bacterium]